MLTLLIFIAILLIFILYYVKSNVNIEEPVIALISIIIIAGGIGIGFAIPNSGYKLIDKQSYPITSIQVNKDIDKSECGCGCYDRCDTYEVYYNKNNQKQFKKITVPDDTVKYHKTNNNKLVIKKYKTTPGIQNHFSLRNNKYQSNILILTQK